MAGKEKRKDHNRVVLRKGEGHRPNGTYAYNWLDANKKRHFIYAKTLEELREKEKELLKESFSDVNPEGKQLRINDMYKCWKELKRGIKANTFQNYCYMYDTYVKPSFGKYKIASVKKSDVKKFYNSLYDTSNLSISTIEGVHTVLRQVFELAEEDEYIVKNPCDNVLKELKKLLDQRQEKRMALTLEEQKIFLDYVKDHPTYGHWYPLFFILVNTGMRIGEATGLRWEDIDLDEQVISVNHTLVYFCHRDQVEANKCKFAINTPKTASGYRQIPMSDAVKKAFIQQREQGIQCNVQIEGYTDFIFLNRFGEGLHQGAVNKAIKRVIRDYNTEIMAEDKEDSLLPNFSCHTLRHTFATRLCEAGVNVKVMQDVLGHSDVRVTLNIYTDATKDFKRSEITSFAQFIDAHMM